MDDPFFDTDRCVTRLLEEYKTHKRLIVAFDFDDTVFDFHQRGNGHYRLLNLLQECNRRDFYLVMFTASAAERWSEQTQYLSGFGITTHAVNCNPIPLPFGNHGKVYYNILLDDRAGLGQAYNTLCQTLLNIDAMNELQQPEEALGYRDWVRPDGTHDPTAT